MNITILGAHNIESKNTRCVSLLIDDVLAVDTGALTSSLTFEEQQKLKAILLTHQHYDHIRDIPAIGMNFRLHENRLDLYSIRPVFDALETHLMNDTQYPNYFIRPADNPILRRHVLTPGEAITIDGYQVLPLEVIHSVPAVGFQITGPDGKKVFFTGDTGPGLAGCWKRIAPDLLIIETTALNTWEEFARKSGHLTPALLEKELQAFQLEKGYLPRVVTVHMNPLVEAELRTQIDAAAANLGIEIETSFEGMRITV
ncbi:MAG: MBL fold metallo-hydrolase [Dehalococcoidales bacterium]|nr:MBL fold metallo-hydrolase [Dehalococcoidales bacterium]